MNARSADDHKISAQPIPTTGAQDFCGKIDIVSSGNAHIAPPTHQKRFECNAGTIPKK